MATYHDSATSRCTVSTMGCGCEHVPIVPIVDLHEFYSQGDLLLVMSRRLESKPGSGDPAIRADIWSSAPLNEGGHSDDSDQDSDSSPDSHPAPDNDYNRDRGDKATRPAVCHFRVSSPCMILASAVFQAMLQGAFKEGTELHTHGRLTLPLPDDDPDVFSILLNILHHHTKDVPRSVSLGKLTRLAILVDKYQMQESAEVFSDMWIDGLKGRNGDVPKELSPDVLPWLFISWVLGKADQFRQTTKILHFEGDLEMEESSHQNLPIPARIFDELRFNQSIALGRISKGIFLLVDEYQQSPTASQRVCKRQNVLQALACDAMVLGSLLRSLVKAGIWPVDPPSRLKELTVQQVLDSLSKVQICSLCEINKDGMHGPEWRRWEKAIHDRAKNIIIAIRDSVKADFDGLECEDFS